MNKQISGLIAGKVIQLTVLYLHYCYHCPNLLQRKVITDYHHTVLLMHFFLKWFYGHAQDCD